MLARPSVKQWNPDGENWVDKGLGGFLETTEEYTQYTQENMGKHKVPTLRNVDLRPYEGFVKAFMRNGVFKTLKEVVNFSNTRISSPLGINPMTRSVVYAQLIKVLCISVNTG